MKSHDNRDWAEIATAIKQIAGDLGFQHTGITDIGLDDTEYRLNQWLSAGRHGDMHRMGRHGSKRCHPDQLVPGTLRIISVRMDYLPEDSNRMQEVLEDPARAYISRYALGRDYHKLMRKRLQALVMRVEQQYGSFGYRVFVDSAPVMEKPIAAKAGLGWIGKHTNLISTAAGSWFFLGEIYTDMPLPVDAAAQDHCGDCQSCMDICPTRAITAPYQLDARLCISYLTIEHEGSIPVELRPMMGNRIYGCDDCQICCPWNRFADFSHEQDFHPRHHLDDITLLELYSWDKAAFLTNTEGSAIRRIGYDRWLRNIAVALGNATANRAEIIHALANTHQQVSDMVQEHIDWAISRLQT
jgi:epoxyqueuosine reductase